jgi:2,3-bisphosphoglycerate-dependent phosphoglycerate mutase
MGGSGVTRLLLARHGETAWNAAQRYQGHLDSPLTALGRAQAEALGERLKGRSLDAVFSSDLGRAVETAKIIVAATGHAIALEPGLRERHLGIFQGRTRSEALHEFPEEYAQYQMGSPDYAVPGGESLRQRFIENWRCLEALVQRHRGKTLLVVTHGGALNGLFRQILGIPLEASRKFSLLNGSLNVVKFREGEWNLETWGDVSHLQRVGT